MKLSIVDKSRPYILKEHRQVFCWNIMILILFFEQIGFVAGINEPIS